MKINKKILLIDDQINILNFLTDLLKGEKVHEKLALKLNKIVKEFFEDYKKVEIQEKPYEVITAERGKQGFNISKEAIEKNKPFSVAVIDMKMQAGME